MVEVFEYRITISPDGHHATSESIYRNIEGSDKKEQFDVDFDEMIENWKGPEYVAERAKEGVIVTERTLKLEKGKLVGIQRSTFSDTSQGFKNLFSRDSLRLGFRNKDVKQIVRTNGTVRKTKDSTYVVWPKTIKDYRLTMKARMEGDHASFVPKFQQYLKKEAAKKP